MRDPGNVLRVQFERFVDQQLIQTAVFPEDERIVEAGDQKDVLDLERHQVVEAFEARFGVEERFGDGAGGHSQMNLSRLSDTQVANRTCCSPFPQSLWHTFVNVKLPNIVRSLASLETRATVLAFPVSMARGNIGKVFLIRWQPFGCFKNTYNKAIRPGQHRLCALSQNTCTCPQVSNAVF